MPFSQIENIHRPIVSFRGVTVPLPLLFAGIMLFAVSMNEYQIFYQVHTSAGRELVAVSHGVLGGHPPWKAFQARLLGPLAFAGFEGVVAWLRGASPAFYAAFERVFSQPDTRDLVALDAFIALMIVVKNFVCFALLRRYAGSLVKATTGTMLGSILFVMLSNHWLYMWDMFELIFFCVLAFMIFTEQKLKAYFIFLFILSLANRESAAFIGVWLLCHAATHRFMGGQILWREAAGGIVSIAVTFVYVATLRHYLLVESTLGHETAGAWLNLHVVTGDGMPAHFALGNHLLILENGVTFLKNLVSTHFYVDVYVLALVLHGGLLVRVGLLRRQAHFVAIGIFNIVLLVGILNFALLNETRLFLICIPFVVFSVVGFSEEIFSFLANVDLRYSPRGGRQYLMTQKRESREATATALGVIGETGCG